MKPTSQLEALSASVQKYKQCDEADQALLKQQEELTRLVIELSASTKLDDTKGVQKLGQEKTRLELMPPRAKESKEQVVAALEELRSVTEPFYSILLHEKGDESETSTDRLTKFLTTEIDPRDHWRIPEYVREISQYSNANRSIDQIVYTVPHPLQMRSLSAGRLLDVAEAIFKHFKFAQ